ncbi:MAG: hypothetical protein AAF224_07645 [Pseudomonadota bacterium]
MGVTLVIIAVCIVFGLIAAMAGRGPIAMPAAPRPFTKNDLKRFSPQKTLFIIGPSADHPACRLQRRLLKPAIALIIREDLTVIELYGDEAPRQNGEEIDWLDPDLLRHAMAAESGFFVIYVDENGQTTFRSEAPVVSADLFDRIGIVADPSSPGRGKTSDVLRKLQAA